MTLRAVAGNVPPLGPALVVVPGLAGPAPRATDPHDLRLPSSSPALVDFEPPDTPGQLPADDSTVPFGVGEDDLHQLAPCIGMSQVFLAGDDVRIVLPLGLGEGDLVVPATLPVTDEGRRLGGSEQPLGVSLVDRCQG